MPIIIGAVKNIFLTWKVNVLILLTMHEHPYSIVNSPFYIQTVAQNSSCGGITSLSSMADKLLRRSDDELSDQTRIHEQLFDYNASLDHIH